MTQQFTKEEVAGWRLGADGFLAWVKAVQPRVPSARGGFEVFYPESFQEQAVRKALARKRNGDFKYTTLAFSMPRRHSKTVLCALLCLWRLSTRTTENIVCLANSERQSMSVGFGLAKKIVLNTPMLLQQIGRENVQAFKIEVPALSNTMRTVSGNVAGLFGERVTVGWCSEIHAAANDEAMQVLASSLGDTMNSWLLIDSTVDGVGGPLHRLEQLQETGQDNTVFVFRVEYANLEEAITKSPAWIRRDWLRSRKAQLLPATFATQHLNQRQASSSNLFAPFHIEACKERLPHPFTLDDLQCAAEGRTYATGGGLDRAYFASAHGDSTIWTTVAKVASSNPAEEAHFFVLNQQNIIGSLGVLIKKTIQSDFDRYSLQNACVEAYNAQDIATWCIERGIPTEIIHATQQAQIPAFMNLHRIVAEGRLHFSDRLEELAQEMSVFQYELKNSQPRFGSDRFHDDRIYSLAWAIHSLRQQELASYSLDSIVCRSKSSHASCCFLRDGDLILPCSNTCEAAITVKYMFNQHMRSNVDSELSLAEFNARFVTVNGIKAVL